MAKTTKSLLKDVADHQASAAGVQLPVGYEISSPREWALWKQYTAARAADEWLDAELVQVCLVIKADLDIERYTEFLEENGDLTTAGNGALKAHPYVQMRESAYSRRDKLAKVLGLRTPSNTKPADRRRNLAANERARSLQDTDDDLELLAQPDDLAS